MIKSHTSSEPLAAPHADWQISLAVAAGCSAIGVGGLAANSIFPGITTVDGLLLVGIFYAALATTQWFAEIRAEVKP